jgi:hypothetical protein
MPLTSAQLQALRVLDWLFDRNENRAEGRTHVVAIALIRQALRYPGTPIAIVDHHLDPHNMHSVTDHLRMTIQSMVSRDPVLSGFNWEWHRDRNGFRMLTPDATNLIPLDWVPTGQGLPARLREAQERAAIAAGAESIREAEDEAIFERLDEAAREPSSNIVEPWVAPEDRRSAWDRLGEDGWEPFPGPEVQGSPDSHEDPA